MFAPLPFEILYPTFGAKPCFTRPLSLSPLFLDSSELRHRQLHSFDNHLNCPGWVYPVACKDPLSFPFFARLCNLLPFFSIACALFLQNHSGVPPLQLANSLPIRLLRRYTI